MQHLKALRVLVDGHESINARQAYVPATTVKWYFLDKCVDYYWPWRLSEH
jgi:hypothetical protein